MEPPVVSSGPMLRRAATFSHRTERALKDMNGRVGHVNKSQEQLSTSKTSVDGEKVTRPGKQFSAVASRYAAPLVSKKQLSSVGDGAHGGHANVTKLPFITGRSAPQHQRRPSSDNLSSFQPPMVFASSARDPKPDTLAKKVDAAIKAVDAKRPRVVKRASMIEKKSQVQTRGTRFSSLDKGGCSCSKNGMVRGSVDAFDTGSASLLYSAAHWVSLIKLAEGEKKHEVVIDLFRLAIRLKAEPSKDVVRELKRYQESYPGDEVVIQLVKQCEDTQQEVCSTTGEVIDKSDGEPGESRSAASDSGGDVLDIPSESKSVVVPAVASGNEAAMKKDVPQKPPHFMGRMLMRSSTFSCVDPKSQSQHAKAEYGKKLAKTMEFLAMQAAAHSPSNTEMVVERSPSEDQDTPGFIVGSKILELASKIGSRLVAGPASDNISSPIPESGSALGNGSTEKPVDSLSEWLDGDASETGTPDIGSVPTEVTVDLCPKGSGTVIEMDVESLNNEVVPHIVTVALTDSLNACGRNGESVPHLLHVRRKSWQDAGGQSMTEIVENISRSHRHNLSSEAVQLSVPGSVEEKVKLFTELAEVKGVTPGITEPSGPGSASKGSDEGEVAEYAVDILAKMESVVDIPEEKECVVKSSAESSAATEIATEVPDDTDSGFVQNEGSKIPLATPLKMLTKQRSMKCDSVTPSIPATPSAATPSEPASVGILRARHRRASSMGNMTPRGPFDMTGECTPFGDSSSSPSGQSSSAKSKRVSRGSKEVTPRMDLPKPSWKAIMEREMKGSKLKDLLAAKLPEETSPLAEYVQCQMENQTRDLESGSAGAKEKDSTSMRTPARSVTKMTKSSSKKKPALKEAQQEGAAEPDTAQKLRTLNEGEQEMDTNTIGCSTPGSAVRRSARIQTKVQSRRNGLFKEEFAHME